MHNEKQEGLRWNLADTLLVLLVLAALVAVGVYLWQRRGRSLPTVAVTYLLRVPDREVELLEGEEGILAHIPQGAAVYSQNGTARLGTVERVWVEPSMRPSVRDGLPTVTEDPFHRHLCVTVRGNGLQRAGDGLRIRDIRIAAGMRGDFCLGGYFAENAEILAVWEDAP